MRPRVFPAEDNDRLFVYIATVDASMRPRVFPAEDLYEHREDVGEGHASMRPRVFPAEDHLPQAPPRAPPTPGFNEAAGIPRGRPPCGCR